MQLYQPEKFFVHIGQGEYMGFCTVWNPPEIVLQRAPVIREKCALIGTLYSRQGVNVILRNLALNPSIRRLYVWGNGNLSQTKFGTLGTNILFVLWKNGLGEDCIVPGTNFKLEKEIDPAVLDQIIRHVDLMDVSHASLDEMSSILKEPEGKTYMEPVRFLDAAPEAVEQFPSEEVGWLVRGHSIADAWKRVVQRVMTYGTVKGTQYGMQQKELIGVTWVAETNDQTLPEDWPQELLEIVGATPEAIEQYRSVFLSPMPLQGARYTYGSRLFAYPNGDGLIDQIAECVVKRFRQSPDTRRAVATTMVPALDGDEDAPCLTQLQFLQAHGALHALATFRSHDIFKAAIPNAFGLRTVQEKVSQELGFDIGKLQITSQSAHIYEQDWAQAKKLTACAFTECDPELVFHAEGSDARGNAVIHVFSDKITVALMGSDGTPLLMLEGNSARFLQKKLAQLDLLSKPDHWMDIGMELQKAQIAKDRGISYTQDRPLVF